MSYDQLTEPRVFWFVENIGGLKFDNINVCENIYPSIITNLSLLNYPSLEKEKNDIQFQVSLAS